MTAAYSVIFALSLLVPAGHFFLLQKKSREPWLFVLYLSVSVVNLGYLLLSFSKTVVFALTANKIAYFGQVFIPLCMFMLISKLSGFSYKGFVKYALISAALLMFSIVLTTGHLDWYYKSVELTEADGAAKLIKEYGFLHPTHLVYVLSYFAAMLAVIGISMKRSKGKTQKLVALMLAVVIGNVGMWIIEKLITWNFEFLAISYLMSELVFFFVYWMMQDYVHVKDISTLTESERIKLGIDVKTMPMETKIGIVLLRLDGRELISTREREILELILDNKKRREIADMLHLSENTVKTYTRTLYSKLRVSCREELYALLTQNN